MYSSASSTSIAYCLLLLATVRVVYTRWIRNRLYRRPPGPNPIPFLGNVHQLPMDYQEAAILEWGKRYGDLIYARFFRRHTIMINSLEVAQELLEKRSANYSSRPPFILHSELMGWKSMLIHMPYGETFRRARKWTHDAFSSKAALKTYVQLQHRETYNLLAGLIDAPEDFFTVFARFTAATVTEVTYGHTVSSLDDSYVRMADEAAGATVEAGSPASMLVDFIPILKYYPTWLPGAEWKRRALAVRPLGKQMVNWPYDMVKEKMAAGTAQPSFVSNLIEQLSGEKGQVSPEDELIIKATAGTLYGAGAETTQNIFAAFLLAMAQHPQIFKKAREEMDRVIGTDRLPEFEDRDSLPYLNCIIRETMRWHVPTPLGVPHLTLKDDEYNGYVIPAKTMVIANIWGMANDSRHFPNPSEFIPERWESMDKETAERLDPRNYIFGFGRRLCPARNFADANSYLVLACMVATLDISRAVDERGREIIPEHLYKSGFVHHLLPFKCAIRPRSEQVTRLIRQLSGSS